MSEDLQIDTHLLGWLQGLRLAHWTSKEGCTREQRDLENRGGASRPPESKERFHCRGRQSPEHWRKGTWVTVSITPMAGRFPAFTPTYTSESSQRSMWCKRVLDACAYSRACEFRVSYGWQVPLLQNPDTYTHHLSVYASARIHVPTATSRLTSRYA